MILHACIIIFICIISFLLIYFKIILESKVMDFVFTLSSIMFSIAYSNISTYNYEIIKNYEKMIMLFENLAKEKNKILIMFIINSLLIIFAYLFKEINFFKDYFVMISVLFSFYFFIYYLVMLSELFTSKKKILDEIREEKINMKKKS